MANRSRTTWKIQPLQVGLLLPWKNRVQPNNATAVEVKASQAGHYHYLTKITVTINTNVNAKFVQVQDDGTNVAFKRTDITWAANVPTTFEVNFPKGFRLGQGKPVQVVSEASGHSTGCWVYVEGFTRRK